MIKLTILFFLFLLGAKVRAQGVWNYMDGGCAGYQYCQIAFYEADPTEHIMVRAHGTNLYYILSDSLLFKRASNTHDDGEVERIIHAGPDGQLLVSDADELPLTYGQVTDAIGYTPYNGTVNPNGYVTASVLTSGLATKENTITEGTTDQYWRGDKTWQTHDKASVGLSNVDNTSDINKPVSTATQAALNAKQNQLNGTGFIKSTGTTISYDNSTYLTAEVDGSTTNEIELPTQTGQSGKVLSTNGTTASWVAMASSPGTNNATAYSSGTVYTLTTTSAKVDFGTTDPQITIPAAGTYLILTNLKIEYAGLTTALNSCSFKLRRTNNTATDLTNATTTFNVPVLTLATGTGGDVDIAAIIYTTSNSNDVIELWGNRSGGLTVGSINVGEASIVAIRIF